MLERLINSSVFKIKQLISLELKVSDNQQWIFHKIHLSKSKGKLNIDNKGFFFKGLGEVKGNIPKNIPVCLTITGKIVLERIIPFDPKHQEEEVLRGCFPNINPKDFYYAVKSNNKYTYVSISRKDKIDKIIDECKKSGIFPVELYVGYKSIENILILDLNKNEKIIIEDKIIKVEELSIAGIFNSENTVWDNYYRLGNELIEGSGILAFASGFSFLVCQNGKPKADHEQIKHLYFERQYNHAFKKIGMSFLVICFVMLLSNFLLFSSLNDNFTKKSAEISIYNDLLTRYKILETDLKQKKELLKITGLTVPSRVSFYADRLASDIPEGITLKRLNIHPFRKKRRGNDFEFFKGSIEIEGGTDNGSSLNSWIQQMGKYDWIKSIEVKEYQLKRIGEPAIFKMLILIS